MINVRLFDETLIYVKFLFKKLVNILLMQYRITSQEIEMTNSQINAKFLASTDAATQTAILANIAKHYGITKDEAYAEVTDEDAEHLLDYITGPARAATSLIMKRHGL